MSRLALPALLLLLQCAILLGAPLDTKAEPVDGHLALLEIDQHKGVDFIDPRWQTAAKEWGSKAQETAQAWGLKVGAWSQGGAQRVGAWSQEGAQKLKEINLGNRLDRLGLWKGPVALIEKVLPDRVAGGSHNENGGKVSEKPRDAVNSSVGGAAVKIDKAEDAEGAIQVEAVSMTDTSRQGAPCIEDSVPPARGDPQMGGSEGEQNKEETQGVMTPEFKPAGAERGSLDTAVELEKRTWEEEPQRRSSAQKTKSPFQLENEGVVSSATLPNQKESDYQVEQGPVAATETVPASLVPPIQIVEARSALDFDEWKRKGEKEKHQQSASEGQAADAESEQPHFVVLAAGLITLTAVYLFARMLSGRSRRAGRRLDANLEQQDEVDASSENMVSTEEEKSDRELAQQLGSALGTAVGSLLAEALRLDSGVVVTALSPEELAQKLQAVCGSALEAHVTDFPRDTLLSELVRSFSQQYRILTSLRAPTSMSSSPFTPSGRPNSLEDLSQRSPSMPEMISERKGEATQSNGAAFLTVHSELDWQTQITEYGSSSESGSVEDRVETTVTKSVILSKPAQNGHTGSFETVFDENLSVEDGDEPLGPSTSIQDERLTSIEVAESNPRGPSSDTSDGEPSDTHAASSAQSERNRITNIGGEEVHERWTFAGSTARHRKTRRRRGKEMEGRQLDFVGTSELGHVQRRFAEMELAERSVSAQEMSNRLKIAELHMQQQRLELESRGLVLKSENNFVLSESNSVRRRSNVLQQEKLRASAARFDEARARALARRCADELVAGLGIMVLCLCWAGYHYGYDNLREKLQECSALYKPGQRPFWSRYGVQAVGDELAAWWQVIGCKLAVAGGLSWGLLVGGFMVTMLLRQNVAGSVQVMPSTVLLLILGGACGYAGWGAVERLGGNGLCWLVLWEALCGLHALAIFPTGLVGAILYPEPGGRPRFRFVSPWVAQLAFHATLVVLLPVAAGILPFVSLRDWFSQGPLPLMLFKKEEL